ncbi:MAG: hypothetical protein IPH97_16180 [Ignavibacteriales bacterium]|nr:hypothetical protein [Ignavibacteriales bacterium]
MKNLVWVFFVIFSFSSNLFPGDINREGTAGNSALAFPSGYGIRNLNGLGNSGLINSTSNLGFLNPASISFLQNLSIGLTYQVNTPTYYPEPFEEISLPRVYNFIPQSFGAVYHYQDFSFGLSLSQEFNSGLNFGEIPKTTLQYPEGTGTTFTPILEHTINKYSLSVAYRFNDILSDNNNLSIGLRYNFNQLHSYEKILTVFVNEFNYASGFVLGLVYSLNENQNKIGIHLKSGCSFHISNVENNNLDIDTIGNAYAIQAQMPEWIEKTPYELCFEGLFQLDDDLQVSAFLSNIFWGEIDRTILTNQFDISSSLIYNFNKVFSGSAGILISNCSVEEYYDNEFNAFYLMAGLKINIESFSIDFSLADSHLISGELRKQFITKLGLGIQL